MYVICHKFITRGRWLNLDKPTDIIICISASSFIFVLWIYEMLATSDYPIQVSFVTVITLSILLISFLLGYSIYIRHTRYLLLNLLFLVIPLCLWFITMLHALTYNYHKNDTLINILGFSTTIIILIEIIWKKIKKSSNK